MSGTLGSSASAEAVACTLDVSRETAEQLVHFVGALARWTPKINLVSRASLDDVWHRHIADSAQLLRYTPPDVTHWADFGSGGGLPGVVCAILLKSRQPDARMTLVESDRRKCAFLASVSRDLGLSLDVRASRVEALPPLSADVISARALAPLADLFRLSFPHLAPGGRLLFPKGAQFEREIRQAERDWSFTLSAHPSITDGAGHILDCSALQKRSEVRPT